MFAGHLSRAIVAAIVILAARAASAQDPLAGPPDAVPPRTPPAVVQRFDFGLGLYEGYDLTLATDTQPGLTFDPRFRQDTSFSSASGTLTYSRQSHDVDFGMSGGGNVRYFSVVPRLFPVDLHGGLSVSSKFTRRTRVHASGSASYSPYYSFGNFLQPRVDANATVLLAPTTDQNIAKLDTYSYNAAAGLTWAPTRKTAVDIGYTGDMVDTASGDYRAITQGGNIAMSHRMTRYSSLRLGYGYRRAQFGTSNRPLQIHDVDAGLGYQRPLSFSRHTVVGFNVGSTVVGDAGHYSFLITGNASLVHQLTRRWTTGLTYNRDVNGFAGAEQLFLSDTVSGSLNGALTRKLAFSLNGGYSLGRLAVDVSNGYRATNAGARLQYPLGRHVPIFAEYVFYHYQFDRPVGLAAGFPLLMTRHGLRTGLSYSVPLVGRRTP